MDVAELDQRFTIPGVLAFEKARCGLVFAHVTTPSATARVCLQGAHLMEWQPAGQKPVLFLSPRSEMAPGKPIRGGIPVIFPWFGPRTLGEEAKRAASPSHGFARTSVWELAFAAIMGDDLHLTFTLGPSKSTRALGYDHFRLACRMILGRELTVELTVANDAKAGTAPLVFEEALHTYYAVTSAEKAAVHGLGETEFLDKTDGMKRKTQEDGTLRLTGTTDRVYLDTDSACVIDDPGNRRRIVVEKFGSRSTVVWNPWTELAAKLPDMEPKGWQGMLCVETANVGENAISLDPGTTQTMRMQVRVEPAG